MNAQNKHKIELYDGLNIVHSFQRFVTAGDLGGTKERLALYGEKEDGDIEKIIRVSWFGQDIHGIEDMLAQYDSILHNNQLNPAENMVLGCAGLIEDNGRYCKFTNIDLEISTPELEKKGLHVELINDFCAYGGVYISGGNARRLKKEFFSRRFMNIFDQSYIYTDKLRSTPVYLVTSNTLGTDGAAYYAFK